MALRQGMRALARSVIGAKTLPTRGGGGGPVKFAEEAKKPLPLWDELWWDDGQLHSQPVLDGVGDRTFHTPAQSATQLGIALSVVAGSIWVAFASWSEDKLPYVPQQYPPEVLQEYTSRGKVSWTIPPTA